MAEANESLPTDDIPAEVNNGSTEQELLDAVYHNHNLWQNRYPMKRSLKLARLNQI